MMVKLAAVVDAVVAAVAAQYENVWFLLGP